MEGEQSIQSITSLKLFNKFITTIRLKTYSTVMYRNPDIYDEKWIKELIKFVVATKILTPRNSENQK